MDITEIGRRLARRPIMCALVALLAVAVGAYGWSTALATRQSTASILVLPPASGDVNTANPLLALDSNVAQLARVLATALTSEKSVQSIRQVGLTSDFSVTTISGENSNAQLSPQLAIVVTGTDPSMTQQTAEAVIAMARRLLESLQNEVGVDPGQQAKLLVAAEPTAGKIVDDTPVRVAVSFATAVLLIGLVSIASLEKDRQE